MILYSDRSCPYAHRVRALVQRVGLEIEERVFPVGEHPPELFDWMPVTRIPLLVDRQHVPEPLVLTESGLMLEYIASQAPAPAPAPGPAPAETIAHAVLRRNAMARTDALLPSHVFGPGESLGDADELFGHLVRAIKAPARTPDLLAFHVGPFWRLLRRRRPHDVWRTRAQQRHPALAQWLDSAAALPELLATESRPRELEEDLRRAASLGMAQTGI